MKITKSLAREAVTVGQFLAFSFMAPPLPIFQALQMTRVSIPKFLEVNGISITIAPPLSSRSMPDKGSANAPIGPESVRNPDHTGLEIVELVLVVVFHWVETRSGQLLRAGHVGFRAVHHDLSQRSQLSKSIHRLDSVGKETRIVGKIF